MEKEKNRLTEKKGKGQIEKERKQERKTHSPKERMTSKKRAMLRWHRICTPPEYNMRFNTGLNVLAQNPELLLIQFNVHGILGFEILILHQHFYP